MAKTVRKIRTVRDLNPVHPLRKHLEKTRDDEGRKKSTEKAGRPYSGVPRLLTRTRPDTTANSVPAEAEVAEKD